jgi:hypothetical protein
MPIQTYFCADHDQIFEISVPFSRKHPPKTAFCPLSPLQVTAATGVTILDPTIRVHTGVWRPSAPNFIVKEGTGALKRSPTR